MKVNKMKKIVFYLLIKIHLLEKKMSCHFCSGEGNLCPEKYLMPCCDNFICGLCYLTIAEEDNKSEYFKGRCPICISLLSVLEQDDHKKICEIEQKHHYLPSGLDSDDATGNSEHKEIIGT